MSTLQELLAQRAEIERKIQETQKAERSGAIAKIRALMAEYGLSVDDVMGSGKTASAGRSSSGGTGKKAPVKFRDAQGNTWSGRGLKPTWLRTALEQGRKLEDFAV